MNRTAPILISLILSLAAQAAEPSTGPTPSQLTIRLYDYTQSSPRLLSGARDEASRVLSAADIDVRWAQCRTSVDQPVQDDSCSRRAGTHVIQLRIHPKEMAKKLTKRGVEFGYAIPLEDGHGIIAGVYLDRTAAIARQIGADLHVVLGHTMAHEIGHLLLGTNSHARRGIMRPTWGDREVHLANTGALGFTDAQADQIQAQVEERLRLAE